MKYQWKDRQIASGLEVIEFAAAVYKDRNVPIPKDSTAIQKAAIWRNRKYAPMGIYAKSKIWYPVPYEVRSCCQEMTPPMLSFPYAYQRHCRTIKHVAALFDLEELELSRYLGVRSDQARCAECSRFRPKDDYLCNYCRQNLALE